MRIKRLAARILGIEELKCFRQIVCYDNYQFTIVFDIAK